MVSMLPAHEVPGPSPTSIRNKPTPKDRGCFQCSQRRIICDRAGPSCGKCVKRGIECSGINRIRFAEGVARRGRLKGFKVPDVDTGGVTCLPSTTSFPKVRWPDEKKQTKPGRAERRRRTKHTTTSSHDIASNAHLARPDPPRVSEERNVETDVEEGVEEIVRVEDNMSRLYSGYNELQPWIAPLNAKTRMLFSHFSEAIAPAMVIFDTTGNGYRELFLPMALEDEVLRRAVAVVAAQHLSREKPELQKPAEAGRIAVISRLRKDSLSGTADQIFNRFTWATLIVLLVGETVTGSSDYKFLIQMLLCLSANSRVERQQPSVNRFLQTQTNMFEMLGVPLLGENNGILTLQGLSQWQDWFIHGQFPEGSDEHRIMIKIRQCYSAACDIYIYRATSGNKESPTSTSPYQHGAIRHATTCDLMELLSQIPPHTPGAHTLVWPCFLGGAEATEPHQRAFFVDYMNSIYGRTRFRNILVAVQSLQSIWASKGDKRWTLCLPEHSNALVM